MPSMTLSVPEKIVSVRSTRVLLTPTRLFLRRKVRRSVLLSKVRVFLSLARFRAELQERILRRPIADVWADTAAGVIVRHRMIGEMTENGQTREFSIDVRYSDFREVPGCDLYEPYRREMRMGGMLNEEQMAQMAEARQQLEEFERQMASLPPDQRAMAERMTAGNILVVDIRGEAERALASIEGSLPLDRELMAKLENMPKDTGLAFLCHHGNASMGAAEYFPVSAKTGEGIGPLVVRYDPEDIGFLAGILREQQAPREQRGDDKQYNLYLHLCAAFHLRSSSPHFPGRSSSSVRIGLSALYVKPSMVTISMRTR